MLTDADYVAVQQTTDRVSDFLSQFSVCLSLCIHP